MGSNWKEYLKEAHRVLKLDKFLWIAETESRWLEDKRVNLIEALKDLGFELIGEPEVSYKFLYIRAIKSR